MTDETKTADAPNAVQTTGSDAIPAEELGRITDEIIGALKTRSISPTIAMSPST